MKYLAKAPDNLHDIPHKGYVKPVIPNGMHIMFRLKNSDYSQLEKDQAELDEAKSMLSALFKPVKRQELRIIAGALSGRITELAQERRRFGYRRHLSSLHGGSQQIGYWKVT
ncbi:hypothetical protein [Enterobacter cancerogenus]